MAADRMNRDQFFATIAPLNDEELRKTLWTLYWRGPAPLRDRINTLIGPQQTSARSRQVEMRPDGRLVRKQVEEFAELARSGAYLGSDRRVSPKERTRWRFTVRSLVTEALGALRFDEVDHAGAAIAILVDLAVEMKDYDYVRSEDPVEAARFVVSDAVAALWSRMREAYGVDGLIERAIPQLVDWESSYGWTRRGEGWVAQRETSLARVLSQLMVAPESWSTAAEHYLDALDAAGGRGRRWGTDLAEWHTILIDHLAGSGDEKLLDRLAERPSLTEQEASALQQRLRQLRGERIDG